MTRILSSEAYLDQAIPAIEISSLKYSYRAGREILDIPTFQVNRGERVFIHGPSGSGKTTLLGLLSGILSPVSGHVVVDGVKLGALTARSRDLFRGDHIGYIFQMFNLIPYLNVMDNIVLPCTLSRARQINLAGATPTVAATAIAARLDIKHLLHKSVTELSVGEQQRVAAARAFIGAPRILIADEPTSALDADHRDEFIALLSAIADDSQATVVFVSHDRSLGRHFHRECSLADLNRIVPRPGEQRS